MHRWDEQIDINAPAESVFAYVSDFARHGEWSGHGLQATRVDDGPLAVGSKFSTEARQFGTQREESTITELSPPEMFGWMSAGALGRIHHSFSLREETGTTTLTKQADIVEPKLLAKLTMFKISRDIPKNLRNDLAKIKATVEASLS
jgi:uncharacterized membrane protein